MSNIQMLNQKSTWQDRISRYSIKKMSVILHLFFLFLAFFLSRAVMFEAAVPFLLPLWAVVRQRFENEKWAVFVGGLAGAVSLSLGQGFILLIQLFIYELLMRFRYWKPPTAIAVALAIFLVNLCGREWCIWASLLLWFNCTFIMK